MCLSMWNGTESYKKKVLIYVCVYTWIIPNGENCAILLESIDRNAQGSLTYSFCGMIHADVICIKGFSYTENLVPD